MTTQKTTGYTDDHAKAGLDAKFPEIETWRNQVQGLRDSRRRPRVHQRLPQDLACPTSVVLPSATWPRKRCLELKSLKEYLFTYRNLGIFQENIVNQVSTTFVKATDPSGPSS